MEAQEESVGTAAPPLAYDPSEDNPLVTALLTDRLGDPRAVDPAIHADDEMLAFLVRVHGGDRDRGLTAYFASGLAVYRALEQLAAWRFGDLSRVARLLDFASGFGRVTRFLLRDLPAARLWVSDVVPAAVAFQAARFGVHGLASSPRAEGFACDQRFDLVAVTSLFTHLPEAAFEAWMRRLAALLAPGGMLVFTTHDASLLRVEEAPRDGLLFHEVSESRQLPASDYGTAWVTESFVRRAVAQAAPELSCHRIPRALSNFQDLYLVIAEPRVDFGGLAYHGDPDAYLETVRFDRGASEPGGEIVASGWARDPGWGRPVVAVELYLDGRLADACRELGERPDVEERLRAPAGSVRDWSCRAVVPAGRSRSRVEVAIKLRLADGADHLLHLSSLEAALGWSARQEAGYYAAELARVQAEAQRDIGYLELRLSAIGESRFWKLRNAWFRLKLRLRLIDHIWP